MELSWNYRQPFVLLENSLGTGPSYLYTGFTQAIAADSGLAALFEQLRHAAREGLHAAGWLGYEAGHALEPRLQQRLLTAAPGWFGLFKTRQILSPLEMESIWLAGVATATQARVERVEPRLTEAAYQEAFAQVHRLIEAGDIYQLNLTFGCDVYFTGDILSLYKMLRHQQRVAYAALVFTGKDWLLSFSPELLFELRDRRLLTRPMKGTVRRAPEGSRMTDAAQAAGLAHDLKNRAENLMIVDLLRNDLARVAAPASVQVPTLFAVESYATVHQLTSTITAELGAGRDAVDVLAHIFPSGSVTGAPKIRAMEIIHELEQERRSAYCGAIGAINADGDATFNVAIRTLSVDAPHRATLGIGSAVVADSIPQAEYAECLLKAAFVSRNIPPFDLIETMRAEPGEGVWQLERHLARLQQSAAYFDFRVDIEAIRQAFADFVKDIDQPSRLRLLVSRFGTISIALQPLPAPLKGPVRLARASSTMQSDNIFLYHKTTHRRFYEEERQRLQEVADCFDCLFTNERGEVTEGAISTLFVRRAGQLLTPALDCGLLPGILRAHLLATGEAAEAVLTWQEVETAEAIYIGNALRGLLPVILIGGEKQ